MRKALIHSYELRKPHPGNHFRRALRLSHFGHGAAGKILKTTRAAWDIAMRPVILHFKPEA